MTLYYINKQTEQVCQCGFEIQKGDIVFLHSNYEVKTIYIDSPVDETSIWRDYRFLDSKSLKSYTFPKTDAIVCKPYRNCKAEGDTQILQKLISECKNEWLTDFLQETNSILSGISQYWDIDHLRRFTRDEELQENMEDGEAEVAKIVVEPENETKIIDTLDIPIKNAKDSYAKHYRFLIEFCIDALADYDEDLSDKERGILSMLLAGHPRKKVADYFQLTEERVRQVFRATVKKVREDHDRFSNEIVNLRDENKMLRHKLLALEDSAKNNCKPQIDTTLDIATLLATPIEKLNLPIRVINCLKGVGKYTFAEIPQISKNEVWRFPNCGRKSVEDIAAFLRSVYLTWGMSYNEIVAQLDELNLQYIKKVSLAEYADTETSKNGVIKHKAVTIPAKPKNKIKLQKDKHNVKEDVISVVRDNISVDYQSGEKDIIVIPRNNHKEVLVGEESFTIENEISESIVWWKELLIIQKISLGLELHYPIKTIVPENVVKRDKVIKRLREISLKAFRYDINNIQGLQTKEEEKSHIESTKTLSRRGTPWDFDQEKELVELYNLGFNFAEIAEYMGRSEVSIMSRLGMLGIIDYTYNKGKS